MCMKNFNSDVLIFDGAVTDPQNNEKINIVGLLKDIPEVQAHISEDDSNTLCIERLNILLNISANECTDEDGKAKHDDNDDEYSTFFFKHNYEILLRLTETNTGNFMDLQKIPIIKKDKPLHLCRNILNERYFIQCEDVKVSLPPKGKDLCVLKVLIKCSTDDGQTHNWIIQSMHPIRLLFDR